MAKAAQPWILGLSNSHNGAACLLRGSEIIAAVQEERLTRRKRKRNHGAQPSLAINYCLDYAGIKPSQLDLVVNSAQGRLTSPLEDIALNPTLQTALHRTPVLTLSHHAAHAVSAFALSGFTEAAVLVVDGVGSPEEDLSANERGAVLKAAENGWEILSLYQCCGGALETLEKHLVANGTWVESVFTRMPRFASLGGMFSAVAWQIFGSLMEAGKVMGLAPYGRPVAPVDEFYVLQDGSFEFQDRVPARYDHSRHWPEHQTEYENLAASTQAALEAALSYLIERLRHLAACDNLCYAGGVALNSVANEKIIVRRSEFKDFYIIPAAEDNGPAVGAAFYGLWQLEGFQQRARRNHDSFGRVYGRDDLQRAIDRTPHLAVVERDDVIAGAVSLLSEGKILGWFQGGSELGARALGYRSILCDPRHAEAKAILNSRVKHREAFRPFAPAILQEKVADWFEMPNQHLDSPFMLRVCPFKQQKAALVPAVVHVDGTGRLQTVDRESNPKLHALLKRFDEVTGVPILLNTSYNVMGEPIVETPEDALWALLYTGLDFCVLGDQIVGKGDLASILDIYPSVAAQCYSLNFITGHAGEGFCATSRRDMFVAFDVETRWGMARQVMSGNVVPVLELIDGKRSGRDILASLPRGQLASAEQPALSTVLLGWQSVSSAVATDPLELTETLDRERVAEYDERTLTRILGRLRRAGVIVLKEAPRRRHVPMDRLRKLRAEKEQQGAVAAAGHPAASSPPR
jgi:carbamoyltransferase